MDNVVLGDVLSELSTKKLIDLYNRAKEIFMYDFTISSKELQASKIHNYPLIKNHAGIVRFNNEHTTIDCDYKRLHTAVIDLVKDNVVNKVYVNPNEKHHIKSVVTYSPYKGDLSGFGILTSLKLKVIKKGMLPSTKYDDRVISLTLYPNVENDFTMISRFKNLKHLDITVNANTLRTEYLSNLTKLETLVIKYDFSGIAHPEKEKQKLTDDVLNGKNHLYELNIKPAVRIPIKFDRRLSKLEKLTVYASNFSEDEIPSIDETILSRLTFLELIDFHPKYIKRYFDLSKARNLVELVLEDSVDYETNYILRLDDLPSTIKKLTVKNYNFTTNLHNRRLHGSTGTVTEIDEYKTRVRQYYYN